MIICTVRTFLTMETLTALLLCFSILLFVQGKPLENKLTPDEEECISKTGVLREVVLQDKVENPPPLVPISDPKFTNYIDCYAEKLKRAGKLFYTKDVAVIIPGYRTKKLLPDVYCTEEELSGKTQIVRQCALPSLPLAKS